MSLLIVEVRPGEGGDHAEKLARRLVAAITSVARRHDADCEINATDRRVLVVGVDRDIAEIREMAGTHRLQGDSKGVRHTSTATVAVLEAEGRSDV